MSGKEWLVRWMAIGLGLAAPITVGAQNRSGDADKNGTVQMADAVLAQNRLFGTASAASISPLALIDGDLEIEIADVLLVGQAARGVRTLSGVPSLAVTPVGSPAVFADSVTPDPVLTWTVVSGSADATRVNGLDELGFVLTGVSEASLTNPSVSVAAGSMGVTLTAANSGPADDLFSVDAAIAFRDSTGAPLASFGASYGVTITAPVCGNGALQTGEACDDGGTDACGPCDAICSGPGTGGVCGDGSICPDLGETCDDGNLFGGDGCGALCAWETCAPTNVAVFRDSDGWNPSHPIDAVFTAAGIPFTVFGSAQLTTANLSLFDKIVIESEQPASFYTALMDNISLIDLWIKSGGVFEFHGSRSSSTIDGFLMPGGWVTTYAGGTSDLVRLLLPGHPTQGTPTPLVESDLEGWDFSVLGAITTSPPSLQEIVEFEGGLYDGLPALALVPYEDGYSLVSMQTLECAAPGGPCSANGGAAASGGQALRNLLLYMPLGACGCGDAIIGPGEICDDGDSNGLCGFCNASCSGPYIPLCGDGAVECGEACDDGFTSACGLCNADCTAAGTFSECGDGTLCTDDEECDDGNLSDGDGCDGRCDLEIPTAAFPFQETWESGSAAPYWTNTGTGPYLTRVTGDAGPHAGSYHLTMESSSPSVFALNEMTLRIDMTGASGVTIDFWHAAFDDQNNGMPLVFTGNSATDGVAVSINGANWRRIVDLGPNGNESYTYYAFDMDAVMAAAGWSYANPVFVRFQQYGNFELGFDGHVFDDIRIYSIVCGDGFLVGPEVCDDGNTAGCDGCAADCLSLEGVCGDALPECAEACDDGTGGTCHDDCSGINFCGDGIAFGAEACDDGANGNACDGCQDNCQTTASLCGNGAVQCAEVCDDGAPQGPGLCANDCSGLQACGNGIANGTEECDDGNLNNYDGCSSTCQIECHVSSWEVDEQGWTHSAEPGGDGLDLWHLTTLSAGDGAASFYMGIEPQNNYSTGGRVVTSLTSPAIPIGAGDFLYFRERYDTEFGAPFDMETIQVLDASGTWLGNLRDEAPAASTFGGWDVVPGLDLSAYLANSPVRIRFLFDSFDNVVNETEGWFVDDVRVGDFDGCFPPVCGDWVVSGGEACDDGNTSSCDGCRADCNMNEFGCGDGSVCGTEFCDDEPGGTCFDDCSAFNVCGDLIVFGGEGCDDGPGGTCHDDCSAFNVCGDGIPFAGEICDDGPGGTCFDDCSALNVCGDGIVFAGEVCDDGAANNGSCGFCSAACSGPHNVCGDGAARCGEICDDGPGGTCFDDCSALNVCGDGIVFTGEACDDGAANNGSCGFCSAVCSGPYNVCGDAVARCGEPCDTGGNSASCDADCSPPSCGDAYFNPAAGEQCDDGNAEMEDGCTPACAIDCIRARFETGDQGYVHQAWAPPGNGVDLWNRTTFSASEGSYSFRMGQPSNPYSFNAGGRVTNSLTSPPLKIQSGDSLTFRERWTGESSPYDMETVQILNASGGLLATIRTQASGFTSGGLWVKAGSFSLNSWVGASPIRIRFYFDSTDSVANDYEGWYVDDVRVGSDLLCKHLCGNGVANAGETCDDGAGGVCFDDCSGFNVCGDGIVFSGEACDDGADGDPCDGCTDACQTTASLCGNLVVDCAEGCDDGFGGACFDDCSNFNVCGDGISFNGEPCDDGADGDPCDGCTDACQTTASLCGNAFPECAEVCDDGPGGPCVDDCSGIAICGDGIAFGDEQCDDGNPDNTDGCSNQCRLNIASCGFASVQPSFENIAGTGYNSGIFGDDYGLSLPIGFTFTHYGIPYSSVTVSTNGYMTFTDTPYDFSNDLIPNPFSPNNTIAPYWYDLQVMGPAQNIFYKTVGSGINRRFIVQWDNVSWLGSPTMALTFQAILYEINGVVRINYGTMTNAGTVSVAGIESLYGYTGSALNNRAGLTPSNTSFAVLPDLCSGCPDGILHGGETCDDGPAQGEGYCLNDCSGYQTCGDLIANGTEACDDGPGGACLDNCSGFAVCGDLIVNGVEVCDDGPGEGEGFCLDDCSGFQICGDLIANGTEICDDGPGGMCLDDCSGF